MTEEASYPRDKAQAFLDENPKRLKDDVLRVKPGHKPNLFPIISKVEPEAHLMVRLEVDGDFALQAFVPGTQAVICRWDRSPHRRLRFCDETGEEITNGHKHYMERNVEGDQVLVKRGQDHIPTTTLQEAVQSFCDEIRVHPPRAVRSIRGSALKEGP